MNKYIGTAEELHPKGVDLAVITKNQTAHTIPESNAC